MRFVLTFLLLAVTLFSKEIKIESEDGFELYGYLEYPTIKKESYKIALFAHQFGADNTIWNELTKSLRDMGYVTLNVDLRGHGKSIYQNGKENKIVNNTDMDHIAEAIKQSRIGVKFENIPSDLTLWLDYLAELDDVNMEKLVLIGSSLGAGAILPLAIDYEPKVLIGISPGGGDDTKIKESLTYANTASLFISGKDDPLGAQNRATKYTNLALRGTNIMVSSSGHGTVLLPLTKDYIFLYLEKYNN